MCPSSGRRLAGICGLYQYLEYWSLNPQICGGRRLVEIGGFYYLDCFETDLFKIDTVYWIHVVEEPYWL